MFHGAEGEVLPYRRLWVGMGKLSACLLILTVFCFHGTCQGGHSLQVFYTGITNPGPGVAEFDAVTYLDDFMIIGYNSLSHRSQPRCQWMAENETPEFWKTKSQECHSSLHWFRTFMSRYTQSKDNLTYQFMYGCELNDDGSGRGFARWGYNGQDFLTLNEKTLTWLPAMETAETVQEKLNSDRSESEWLKPFLGHRCINRIKTYIKHGEQALSRKVCPDVRVSHSSHGDFITLHCYVHGFYPRDIEVTWVTNGKIRLEQTTTTGILPNHDNTYYIRESVDIDPKREATYSCQVEHSSLPTKLNVDWERKGEFSQVVIISGAITAVLLIVMGILTFVLRQRRRKGLGGVSSSVTESTPAIEVQSPPRI